MDDRLHYTNWMDRIDTVLVSQIYGIYLLCGPFKKIRFFFLERRDLMGDKLHCTNLVDGPDKVSNWQ